MVNNGWKMKEFAFTCCLRSNPQIIAEYDRRHAAVWPEVLFSLRQTGILNARIYRLGHRLFMIFQTLDDYDPAAASQRHWNSSPRVREWEELMASFQERPPEAPPGVGKWVAMEKVFEM